MTLATFIYNLLPMSKPEVRHRHALLLLKSNEGKVSHSNTKDFIGEIRFGVIVSINSYTKQRICY